MSEFYNRYRGLFDSSQSYSSKETFQKQKERFLQTNQQHSLQPTYTPSLQARNKVSKQIIGKSPALDEFERNVLPRLRVKYPIGDMYRLKTEMHDSVNNIQQSPIKSNAREMEFYQLPKIYAPKVEPARKQRILTEGSVPIKTRTKFRDQYKDISKSIEELQREYFRYYPRENDKVIDGQGQRHDHLFNSRARIATENKKPVHISQNISSPKRWQVKTLIHNEPQNKKGEVLPSPPKISTHQDQYKAYQNRQKELYGIKENPFAFVNSKVQEIKKSQRYIPRGFINHYREALLKRKQFKDQLQERREKLRTLLYSEDIKYGFG